MLLALKAGLAEVIACGRTETEILERALDCIRDTCGLRWVGLYRIAESRSLVENVVYRGGAPPAHPTFAIGSGLTGLAIAQKKTVVVHDVAKEPHYLPTLPDTRTEAIIPVMKEDSVVGTIDIEGPAPNSLRPEVICALEGCARALSPVLNATGVPGLKPRIRPAVESDLAQITAIDNYYVENTHLSFDLTRFSADQRRPWFVKHRAGSRYRLMVAESEQHGIIGYASSGQFRPKEAYDTTVELGIQCAPTYRSRGIGTRLYRELLSSLAAEDARCAIAGIALPNPASVALHERMRFEAIGKSRQVFRKFDRYWDVLWMQKLLQVVDGEIVR